MNQNRKLLLGKILIIISVIGIGGGIMIIGIYYFTNDSWKPLTHESRPSIEIPNLGQFETNLHSDYGLIPGNYLQGDLLAAIAVPNNTKVKISLPGALIPGETNYTAGLEPAMDIPMNFTQKESLQTNGFRTQISGLVYYQPGEYDVKLIITKNNATREYTISDIISIQPYSYYESQRNNNLTMATLYFTAGLVLISTSPVFVKLYEYISEFRKKSVWELWIKQNNINMKIFSSRQKITIFFVGFTIVCIVYLFLWIGSIYQQSTTEFEAQFTVISALVAPLVYVSIMILVILSTSFPIFFKWIKDPGSRPIYVALAGAAAGMGVIDLTLIIHNVCLLPFYAQFGKCTSH